MVLCQWNLGRCKELLPTMVEETATEAEAEAEVHSNATIVAEKDISNENALSKQVHQ